MSALNPREDTIKKNLLKDKWLKWISSHPFEPYPHKNEYIPVIKIAYLLGYKTTTVTSYLYRNIIKNKICESKIGDAKFLVTVEDLVDYMAEQDMKNRFFDFTSH